MFCCERRITYNFLCSVLSRAKCNRPAAPSSGEKWPGFESQWTDAQAPTQVLWNCRYFCQIHIFAYKLALDLVLCPTWTTCFACRYSQYMLKVIAALESRTQDKDR